MATGQLLQCDSGRRYEALRNWLPGGEGQLLPDLRRLELLERGVRREERLIREVDRRACKEVRRKK